MDKINLIEVESSNISHVGFLKDEKQLIIKFKNDSIFIYNNVEEDIYNNLLKSDSIGKYFYSNIRTKYEFKKLDMKVDTIVI